MNIGDAIEAIKRGDRATREGWNGKDIWIAYSPGKPDGLDASCFWSPANQRFAESQPNGCAPVRDSITLKTATGEIVPGWSPSGSDALATDWRIII